MRVLLTGGAGFIGSCYVLARCTAGDTIINLDKLTYSGNLENLASLHDSSRHICMMPVLNVWNAD